MTAARANGRTGATASGRGSRAASCPPTPLELGELQTWMSFIQVATRTLERLDRELQADHGLSLADYEMLAALSEAPDRRLLMSDLASSALLSASRLTYRVDRLVNEGLVERVPCPTDRRRTWAELTPAGFRKLKESYPRHLEGVRRYVIDPPSTKDLASLRRALDAMLQALDEHDDADEASLG